MATLNLGRIKPVFRGAYSGGTAYVIDDIVTSGGETFICIQASTGNATSSASHWTKLAEKGTNGTNGTDVGTTITTQGDILYRDGSGLQRLGAGTNGQALLTGGAGANPSWGTISSGFELLGSVSASGSSSLSLDGFYSSDYDVYEIYGSNIVPNTNNGSMRWRVRSGNSDLSGTNYIGGFNPNVWPYYDGSGYYNNPNGTQWGEPSFSRYSNFGFVNTISLNSNYSNDTANTHAQYKTDQTGHNISWKLTAYSPLSSRDYKHYKLECVWNCTNTQSVGKSMGMNGYFSYNGTTSAHSGITFYPESGNFTSGKVYMYGLKNS